MMTTSRLLCALLVLVLCCCPSVCAGDTQPEVDVESSSKTTTTTTTQPPVSKEKSDPKPNLGAVPLPPPPGPSPPTAGQPGMQSNGSAEQPGNNAGDRGSLPGPHPQSSGAHNTVQREGTEDTSGTKSGTSTSTEKIVKEADDTAKNDHDDYNKGTNHDNHDDYNRGTNHDDHRGANHDDHPRTVASSRSRRQPQQLCVGVCPAAACCNPRWRTPLLAKRERGLCVPALNHGDMCTSTVVLCIK
ncbi:mucin TcMUCII [Trypanosoma cruzi cruzi]|nr:mucin TcMUCII [Trypanosoma cruzi cruzi]